jgi:hypothetical protein
MEKWCLDLWPGLEAVVGDFLHSLIVLFVAKLLEANQTLNVMDCCGGYTSAVTG